MLVIVFGQRLGRMLVLVRFPGVLGVVVAVGGVLLVPMRVHVLVEMAVAVGVGMGVAVGGGGAVAVRVGVHVAVLVGVLVLVLVAVTAVVAAVHDDLLGPSRRY